MQPVTIYSKIWCPFCQRAKALLTQVGAAFDEIDIEAQPERRAEMIERSGQRTVPQIWVGDTHVGGCDELFAFQREGKLDSLLHND